jgi:hypothetical protein
MRGAGPWVALVVALACPGAAADDAGALRAENERLRARVEALEQENARLRGVVRDAQPPLPTRIVERAAADGTAIAVTEPGKVDVSGSRSRHWMWMERRAAHDGATLWLRADYSGGVYGRAKQLTLRFDGKGEHRLPIASYDARRLTTGVVHRTMRRDHELVSVALPPALVVTVARAATMDGRLGRTRFAVPPEVLASLRALARRPALSGDRPASSAPPPSPPPAP